jgi:hypothetical protein
MLQKKPAVLQKEYPAIKKMALFKNGYIRMQIWIRPSFFPGPDQGNFSDA